MGKRDVLDWLGLSNAEVHIHFGLAAFLFLAVLLRRYRFGLITAWAVVFLLQTMNEVMDARDWIRWTGGVNWPDTAGDYVNTMLWPTIIALLWWRCGVTPDNSAWRNAKALDENR